MNVHVLTPAHIMFGRRLTSIPDERIRHTTNDEDAGEVMRRFGYLARLRRVFGPGGRRNT